MQRVKDQVKDFARVLWGQVLGHRTFIVLVLLYCAAVQGVGIWASREVSIFLYSPYFLIMIALTGVVHGYVIFVRQFRRPDRSDFFKHWYADIKNSMSREQVAGGIILFVMISSFISFFQSFKAMLTVIKPFSYDVLFAQVDRSVHAGFYPHELLQPYLGFPETTLVIQFFYNLWIFVMLGVLVWQMFDRRRPELRMRFLISFVLVWMVCGSVGAVWLSSAGPVYFDRVTGLEGPYEDHMAWLWSIKETTPLFFLDTQDFLWENYVAGKLAPGIGISAMPSMHVSIATLLFLFARHFGRWVGLGFGAFLIIIQLGSVHLAWHYAIDGYLGAVLTLGVWWVTGRFYKEPQHSALPHGVTAKSDAI